MEKKTRSIALASTTLILFLILALTMASAASTQRVVGNLTLTETQITTNHSSQEMPAIYGDTIVWEDNRNGEGCTLYAYNISTSEETPLSDNYVGEFKASIYGDRVVWQYIIDGYPYAHMYNLSTSTETQITVNPAWEPIIYGDKIVCTDGRAWLNGNTDSDNADVYMYDVFTSQETQITTNESWQGEPAIYKDRIVWKDARNGVIYSPADIYMYNVTTATETQITDDNYDQYTPDIYEDRIVWSDNRNGAGNWDVYMYNISTGTETQITTDVSSQEYPVIYGDRIVWQDMRNGGYDVYMYDLSTSTETQITDNAWDQIYPKIYENKIVWEDFRNGMNVYDYHDRNPDIYMCTISENGSAPERPCADFSANVTCGYAPLTVQFTDISENAVKWYWDFGDKTYSADQNPVHTYSKEGKYTVSLTVKNADGTNTEAKAKCISISKGK